MPKLSREDRDDLYQTMRRRFDAYCYKVFGATSPGDFDVFSHRAIEAPAPPLTAEIFLATVDALRRPSQRPALSRPVAVWFVDRPRQYRDFLAATQEEARHQPAATATLSEQTPHAWGVRLINWSRAATRQEYARRRKAEGYAAARAWLDSLPAFAFQPGVWLEYPRTSGRPPARLMTGEVDNAT